MTPQRGTTWKDALGEFVPTFLATALPALFVLVTGILDSVTDAVEAGRTPDLQFGLWVSSLVSICTGALAGALKVVFYKFSTKRGVA